MINKKNIWIGVIFVVLLIVVIGYFILNSTTSNDKFVAVGEEGRLDFIDGGGLLYDLDVRNYMIVEEKVMNDLLYADKINDELGHRNILLKENVYWVKNGARVLVIDRKDADIPKDITISQIRILDGLWRGKSGWVISEWIVKE